MCMNIASFCMPDKLFNTIDSARSLFPPKQTKIYIKKTVTNVFLLVFHSNKVKTISLGLPPAQKIFIRSCYLFEIKYHIMETSCQFGKVPKLFFTSCIS